ncbi:acylphosphatase [Kistimonas asteriae]|uniref:acylphosphatase n=1 Tax=Kistimonas asteriae TaxID=517724 RepID=UPI001BA7C8FE|nr:acylphosphatase [Kistimonas asteriae]
MTMVCRRALVDGKVQGVWFRGSTREQALTLGITGYAKNLPDGRVEVMMSGRESDIEMLSVWLKKGPPLAVVKSLDIAAVDLQQFPSFEVC